MHLVRWTLHVVYRCQDISDYTDPEGLDVRIKRIATPRTA